MPAGELPYTRHNCKEWVSQAFHPGPLIVGMYCMCMDAVKPCFS